jgi:phage tail-like protein
MPSAIDTGREDPLVGFLFALDIQGVVKGYFTECSGIGSESEIAEQKVVSEKGVQIVLKVPGRLKWSWRKMVEDGAVKSARKNGTITMFDQTLTTKAKWEFKNAWPSKISGPSPKSDGNDIQIEEITIVHEYITRVKV